MLAAVLALAVTAGCHAGSPSPSPSPVATGTTTRTVTVGGAARTFRLYRPASLPGSGPVPLVVMLHGGFGSAKQAEEAYGWDARADAAGFVVAYPDGVDRAWNVGGGCCGSPGRTGVDDVAFISRVVADVEGVLPIDPARVYATGISNGGLLAYRLACDTRLFAAIGPDSATLLGPCPNPAPVSVVHIHGTADRNIRYDGGPGDGVAKIDGPAVPDVLASWRQVDGCAAPVVTVAAPLTTSVATCPAGRTVELVTIDGAGHQWPGAASRPAVERLLGLDPPSDALNATDTIWRFFATHPAGH